MKISVVIPVYNVAPYLYACLRSVVDGLRVATRSEGPYSRSVEIICVDDGSTDSSGDMLDEYAYHSELSGDPNVEWRVLHQSNQGVSAARNKGLSVATGDWLMFVDGDDVLVPDALKLVFPLLETGRYDAFLTGDPHYFRDKEPCRVGGTLKIVERIDEPQNGKLLLLSGRLWGWPVIRILRRSLFGSKLFPVGIANLEDSISLLDVLSVKARWCWVDMSIYGYRTRTGSATSEMTVSKVESIIRSFALMYHEARSKIGLSHKEALVLMRQYSSHMSIYVASVAMRASTEELVRLAVCYRRFVADINYRMLNIFIEAILGQARLFNTRIGLKALLRGHRFLIRIDEGLRRRCSWWR